MARTFTLEINLEPGMTFRAGDDQEMRAAMVAEALQDCAVRLGRGKFADSGEVGQCAYDGRYVGSWRVA